MHGHSRTVSMPAATTGRLGLSSCETGEARKWNEGVLYTTAVGATVWRYLHVFGEDEGELVWIGGRL